MPRFQFKVRLTRFFVLPTSQCRFQFKVRLTSFEFLKPANGKQESKAESKQAISKCFLGLNKLFILSSLNVLFPHSHLELCPSHMHLGSHRLDSLIHYYYLSKLVTLLLKCEAEEQRLDVWIVDKELHYLRKSLKHSSWRHCLNGIFYFVLALNNYDNFFFIKCFCYCFYYYFLEAWHFYFVI